MNRIWLRASTLRIVLCLCGSLCAWGYGVAQNSDSPPARSLENARVDAVDVDHGTVVLTDCPFTEQTGSNPCSGQQQVGSVTNSLKPQLKQIHIGDHVKVSFQTDKMDTITAIGLRSEQVSPFLRILALALAYVATFMMAVILTRGHPIKLIIGVDNRYSNSQFQMALWFSILISTYIAMIFLRVLCLGWEFWGCVDLPVHLFALSGASALTFGAAKGITTSKVQAAQAAGVANPKPSGNPHFLLDLVSDDSGGFDLGDFQMLVVSLLAVAMYLVTVFQFFGSIVCLRTLSLPDVDTTILAAFGLGQGAYLTKKAAGNLGTS